MHATDSAAHMYPVHGALCWTLTSAPDKPPSVLSESVGVISAAYVMYDVIPAAYVAEG